MNPSGRYVLDSFALLAYLAGEHGAGLVREVLEYGQRNAGSLFVSVVNLGECAYIVEREEGLEATHRAIAAINQLPVEVVVADRERTFAAAHVKARFKVSFADAFATALAQERQATVLTGDPEFKEVEGIVQILWMTR